MKQPTLPSSLSLKAFIGELRNLMAYMGLELEDGGKLGWGTGARAWSGRACEGGLGERRGVCEKVKARMSVLWQAADFGLAAGRYSVLGA